MPFCKNISILIVFFCFSNVIFSQTGGANICTDAEPICSSTEFSFLNTSDSSTAELGPDYGCLLTQPNPAWFFLQIGQSGDVNLIIEQSETLGGSPNLDVDFILYGPFLNVMDACDTSLTASNTIDCSYSPNGIENANIPNAVSGEYYLLLVTNFSGNAGFISIQQLTGDGTTNCAILEGFKACEGDAFTLNATTPNATNYLWFEEDASNPGNYLLLNGINSATLDVYDSKNYRAHALDNSGSLIQLYEYNVEFLNTPSIPSNILPYVICDNLNENDGIGEFDLSTKTSEILNGLDPSLYSVTYYESELDAQSEENSLPNIYNNITNPQNVFVRIENSSSNVVNCFNVGSFSLEVNLLPDIDLDETYILCVNKNGTEVISNPILDTGLNETDYIFQWIETNNPTNILSVQSIFEPIQGGMYSVLVTEIVTGCINTATTNVLESSPPILSTEVITQAFENNHLIQVSATGEGVASFEFSLDNGPWSGNEPSSNSFTFANVSFGEHIIQARDINGCGLSVSVELIVDYPKVFTPNNDGYNDTWQIFGIENQIDAVVYIFDQYGKLLKQLSPTGVGWDGTFNGQILPSDDYWFVVKYREFGESEGAQKQFKSHFTLKR